MNRNELLKENKGSRTRKTSLFIPGGFIVFLILQYIIFMDSWAWSFLNPSLAFFSLESIRISIFQFGFYLGFFNFIILIGQIILCRFEKYNKNFIIFIAGLLHFIGYGYLVISANFFDLLIMATITGIGMSILLPTVSLYIKEISLEQNQGFNFSFLTTTTQIAGILGLLLGGLLGDFISYHYIFIISAFSLLSISIIVLLRYLILKKIIRNDQDILV
jgi:MFS family permease